jgi:hypothetical protein
MRCNQVERRELPSNRRAFLNAADEAFLDGVVDVFLATEESSRDAHHPRAVQVTSCSKASGSRQRRTDHCTSSDSSVSVAVVVFMLPSMRGGSDRRSAGGLDEDAAGD